MPNTTPHHKPKGYHSRGRVVGITTAFIVFAVLLFSTAPALADGCPNEALRVGPSASLPDCRAYELVTPADLGRTQDMTFADSLDHASPSGDGEHLMLVTNAPIEPNPETSASANGTTALFSRTAAGWVMRSVASHATAEDDFGLHLFSPDLSQVALESSTVLNGVEGSPYNTFEVGPVGGPYSLVASVPNTGGESTSFVGANTGSVSVLPFSDVLLSSKDHGLPLSAAEHLVAEGTVGGSEDLYEWSGGKLRLVNVTNAGALTSLCGAVLGEGFPSLGPGAVHAVSGDGSKVFFTSPEHGEEAVCPEPSRLYMRVDGRETVDVSKPQGVVPSERKAVSYVGAAADGSKVFFTTETALTAAAEKIPPSKGEYLYEYDTEAPEGTRLKVITGEAEISEGNPLLYAISEDGSTVYFETPNVSAFARDIYRYETGKETGVGNPSFVARAENPLNVDEPSYTTPNGESLLFASTGVSGEPRGVGHNEFYRYDHADGGVVCVSCGAGAVPAKTLNPKNSEMVEPRFFAIPLEAFDALPGLPMSDDGGRVFFETTARLVPQDTNSTEFIEATVRNHQGLDTYEWEADGVEERPGVFCRVANGCTHLISSGQDVGPEAFVGASRDGRDLFFVSAAQLVPQATAEFSNIYDARIGGGFAPASGAPECSSCQGVGSPPPLFSTPASETFAGSGNPVPAPAHSSPLPPAKKTARCPKGKHRSHGRCVRVKAKRKRAR
jgi:hypothetical protein